jgi:hypothetical protein
MYVQSDLSTKTTNSVSSYLTILQPSDSSCLASPRSVPDAPRAMVGDGLDALPLALFGEIVQEEVDEDGVDFGLGGEQKDLAAQELDGPDAAACT